MEKILIAVDFSPACVQALDYALRLGEKFDSHLLLLHVLHDPADAPGFYASQKAGKKVLRNMEAAASEMMDAFAAKHLKKWEKFETRIIPGLPADQIVRQARKDKVDLIVMGTRGHSSLKRLMLGSVADKVIRASSCPVLVVHEEKKPRK
jgi:nucleotide-binding universal stress UspA family protein